MSIHPRACGAGVYTREGRCQIRSIPACAGRGQPPECSASGMSIYPRAFGAWPRSSESAKCDIALSPRMQDAGSAG